MTRDFVDRTFNGSIFDMFAAFYGGNKISDKDAEKIKKMIDSMKE